MTASREGSQRNARASCTRRRFLTGALALVAAPLLSRCGGAGSGPASAAADVEAQAKTYDPALDCSEAKGLWPAEQATRTDNEYGDQSTQPGQYCFNCSNFEKPKTPGTCATCRTVKGPIHPLGWCKAWTEVRS